MNRMGAIGLSLTPCFSFHAGRRIQHFFLFLCWFLYAGTAGAQVYPVQTNIQLIPPYSLYLADYVESGSERLALNVFLSDISRPELNVRFRLKIIGQGITLETKPNYIPPPVTLQSGVPLRLISTDLAEYFNPNNLTFQGISQRQYEQRGKLPEGVYQFCFEVLEYNRGLRISNTACATAWLVLNDPPMVNLPRQNEKLKAQSPQNVILQWTPRHTGSPNSAFQTEYEIRMVEVWPATRNPNDAILTSPPILEETTRNTTYIYGPAETPLEPGRRYAFRIQAKSIAGTDELDLFKNNGYSEVFSFVYGDACDLPTGIAAGAIGSTRFDLSWEPLFNHTAFKVRYRQAGTSTWYENNVTLPSAQFYALKPSTTYEYQVAATCGFFDGTYSGLAKVTTAEEPAIAYSCGIPLTPFNLDPSELVGSLKPGDVIRAGDFDVKLVTVSGSNGVFTGEGVIEVPYLNKAKVKTSFTSITVNKELRMVNGSMNVTGAGVDIIPQGVKDAMDELSETLDVIDSALTTIEENLPQSFDPNSFVADTLIKVKDGISSVYKNDDGSVVVVDKNGNEQRLPPGTTAAITDDAGNGYLIDKKGNIHKTTADVATKAANRKYNLLLTFANDDNARYGFDVKKHEVLTGYETLESGYKVAWKSVASHATDVVTAKLMGTTDLDSRKIHFELGGATLQATPLGNTQPAHVTLTGKTEGMEEGLLAVYAASDTGKVQVLGKLNVVTYDEIQQTLVIVPVNGAKYPYNIPTLRDSLNRIYGQAVVKWSVVPAEGINGVTIGTPFDDGETGLLSNYTPDMKKVINAYKGNMDDDKFYLFLIGGSTKNNQSLAGYMPRSKQAGFIFVDQVGNEKELIRTVAHELGHGAFNLAHTFKEEHFTLPENSTDNLMDYKGGQKLYKFQWDKIRYPDIVIGMFEEDEDAEYIFSDLSVFKDLKNPDDTYTFLSPGGKPVTLPKTVVGVILTDVYHFKKDNAASDAASYPLGTLIEFALKMEDGTVKTYGGRTLTDYDNFVGYRDDNGELYKDVYTAKLTSHTAIIGYPCLQNKTIDFFAYKIDTDKIDKSFWPSEKELSSYHGGGTYKKATAFLNDLAELEFLNYDRVNPIVKGPVNVGASASNNANVTEFNLNNEEVMSFLEDLGGCGTVIQNNVLQILNIIALNPGTYTALKKCERDSLVTVKEYRKHAGGHHAWYPRFVQYVKDRLVKKIEARQELLKTVGSVGNADDLEDLLAGLCEEEYKMFTAKQRLNILRTLAKGDLQDCWTSNGNNNDRPLLANEKQCAEAQVIYTLEYASADQYKEIFDELKKDSDLTFKLIAGLDNAGAGGNNFDRLALQFYTVWYNNETTEVTDELLETSRVLNYEENFFEENIQAGAVNYSSSSSYTFMFEMVGGKYKITPAVRTVSRTGGGGEHMPPIGFPITQNEPIAGVEAMNAAPFEFILVRFESDMKFPGEDFVIFPKSKDPQKIPAFLLYWLIEANDNKLTMRDAMMRLNLTLMALGGVEMATARGIRLVFATVDFIAATSTLVLIQLEVLKELQKLVDAKKLDPIWLDIVNGYNNVMTAYSFFRGGQAASLLFRASILKLASYKNLFPKLTENLKSIGLTKKALDDIDRVILLVNGIDGTIPPPPPSGPVSPLFKGISSVDKEVLGLSRTRITAPGFQNNGFSSFVRAAKTGGGYDDVLARFNPSNYSSAGISSGSAEVLIKQGVDVLAKVYPAGIKITQKVAVQVVEAAEEAAAAAAVQAQVAPKLAIAQIAQTADGPIIWIASDPARSTSSAASPSLLPQILYAAPAVATRLLEKIKEEEKCKVCIDRVQVCRIFEQITTKAVSAGMAQLNAENAANKICQNIASDILLLGVASKINAMEPAIIRVFLEDILGTHNTSRAPNNSYALSNNVSNLYPKLIDGWIECRNARPRSAQTGLTRLDIALLRLVGDDTQNANFMTALTINGENKYRKLLSAYVGPCNTCVPPADSIMPAKLPLMHVYLSTFEQFAKGYSGKANEGLNDFISGEATAAYSTKQDGAYHLMRHLNVISEGTVSGFERVISTNVANPVCSKCKCDVLMRDGTMVDYKSYGIEGISNIYGNQFKQYLQRWTPNTPFKYIFNGQKANLDEIKQGFQRIFKNHPELYNVNPAFFQGRSWEGAVINNMQDFKDLLDEDDFWKSGLFEFIETN